MSKLIKIIYFIFLIFYILFFQAVNAQEKIKIGLLVPMTGSNKELGNSIIKAVRLAVKDIDNDLIEIFPKDTATKANHGGTPFEIKDINATLDAPIKNGIDKSRPPNNATNVCPTVAKPKNAANTNIDFIFSIERNPLIVSDPNINNPIKTQIPMNTLF